MNPYAVNPAAYTTTTTTNSNNNINNHHQPAINNFPPAMPGIHQQNHADPSHTQATTPDREYDPIFEFGYDHNKHMSKPAIKEWLAARQALPSGASSKPLLLRALEKCVGDWREPRALNPKDYLQDGYKLSQLSIAKMRQILSQYNIDYPERASKPVLERVLSAEMPLLRQANGIANNDPRTQDLAGSLNQMDFTAEPNQTQEPQYEVRSRVIQQQQSQQQQAGSFGYSAPSTKQPPTYEVFVSSSGFPALRGVSATTDQVVQPTSAFAVDWNNPQRAFRHGGPVKDENTILQPNSVPANAQQTASRLRPLFKPEAGMSSSPSASNSMYGQYGHQYHTTAASFGGQNAPSYQPASGMLGHNPSNATRVRFSQPLQSTTEGTGPTPIPGPAQSPSSFYEKSRHHLSQQPAQPGSLETSNQPYPSIPQSVPHTFGQPSQMGKAALPQTFNVPKSSNVPANSNGFEPNTTASSHQQAEAAKFREWISKMLENRIPSIAGTANSIDEVETMFYEIVQSLRRGERE